MEGSSVTEGLETDGAAEPPCRSERKWCFGQINLSLTECVGVGQVGNGGPRAVRGTSWEAVLMVHK